MKKVLLSVLLGVVVVIGYNTTRDYSTGESLYDSYNTLQAATVPEWTYNGQLPFGFKPIAVSEIKKDTVIINDTVTVNNIKYVQVPVPRHTTDTIFIPLKDLPEVECVAVKNKNPGDREEQSQDESVAETGIVLIVDGNTVYTSSKNVNHSGGDSVEPTSVDEP